VDQAYILRGFVAQPRRVLAVQRLMIEVDASVRDQVELHLPRAATGPAAVGERGRDDEIVQVEREQLLLPVFGGGAVLESQRPSRGVNLCRGSRDALTGLAECATVARTTVSRWTGA